jgi:transcriptional regulator with XRE-family HTH domain
VVAGDPVSPNPLAQQRRLGAALYDLRIERQMTHAELSRASGVSASVISRTERPLGDVGRRPTLLTIRKLLDALGVPRGSAEFTRIEGHAEVAAKGGWWDGSMYLRMGDGQRDYAVVEYGSAEILEYAGLFLPGLVQTAEVTRHRARLDDAADVDAVVGGRMERQRRAEGVTYRLLLEEQAIHRRHGIPPKVMREQLAHLLDLAARPNVSIRVLPVRAEIGDGPAPRAPYAHMTYPDPDDPPIVIVDGGVKRSSLTADAEKVAGYAQLHTRLCSAAVSEPDTVALIRSAVHSLAAD